jgi:hypothetical protein
VTFPPQASSIARKESALEIILKKIENLLGGHEIALVSSEHRWRRSRFFCQEWFADALL